MAFGSAIHSAAEILYRNLMVVKKVPPNEYLLRVFKGAYESFPEDQLIYGEKASKADLFKTAEQIIGLLSDETPPANIVAVEEAKVVDLDALKIIQRVDLVTRSEGDNVLTLWDLKTAARRYGDEEKAKAQEQLSLYAVAYDEPVRLKAKVLLKQKTPSIENVDLEYNPDQGPAVVSEICNVKHAIENGVHYKIRSFRCQTCGYKHLCRPELA